MSCSCDGRTQTGRAEVAFTVHDRERGRVTFRFIERPGIDDATLHIIEKELFQLAGGVDGGDDVDPSLKDFLIRENYLEV